MLGCGRGIPWQITPHKPTDTSLSQAWKWLTKPGEAIQTHIAELLWNRTLWFLSPNIPGLLSISLVWCDGKLLGGYQSANVGLQGLALRAWSLHTNGVTEGSKGTYFTSHSIFFWFLQEICVCSWHVFCLPAQCPREDLSSHILTHACTLQGSLPPASQQPEPCHNTLLISRISGPSP